MGVVKRLVVLSLVVRRQRTPTDSKIEMQKTARNLQQHSRPQSFPDNSTDLIVPLYIFLEGSNVTVVTKLWV